MNNQTPLDIVRATLSQETNSFLDAAIAAATKARDIQLSYKGRIYSTHQKDLHDIVTEVDLASEKAILDEIQTRFPDHGFKSEEAGASEVKERQWVIDPLDGTINYVARLPFYSVSLALQQSGVTEVGVILVPESDELYVAINGSGAFVNGMPIRVSGRNNPSNSVLSFMLTSHYTNEQMQRVLQLLAALSPQLRGMRLLVSQAIELAYIASGKLEGHVCIKSRGFSAAAGVLLLREAGGRVTDLQGAEFSNSSRSLLASNGKMHDWLLETVVSMD